MEPLSMHAAAELFEAPPELQTLREQVASVRQAVFELTDNAREAVPHALTLLHVRLQSVSNELGAVERLLREV